MALVRCPECSQSIGEVYRFVKCAREGLVKKYIETKKYDSDIAMLEFDPDSSINIKFILDAAGLVNLCCRAHVSTLRKFNKDF